MANSHANPLGSLHAHKPSHTQPHRAAKEPVWRICADFCACRNKPVSYHHSMFTIEHEFDATVITLVDEGDNPADYLQEDITINSFEDCVTIEQLCEQTDEIMRVTFSHAQLRELAAALDLPEGVYRLRAVPVKDAPES